MRAYVPGYEVVAPGGLDEVLQLLADKPGVYKPLAGGTDVMVLYNAGKLTHTRYVSIAGIAELSGIEVKANEVKLGALATYTDVRHHPVLRQEFPMLSQAAAESGAVAIQNRGTIGGNIANASPAADTPPALLAYDAELEVVSKDGSRRVPYRGFHTGYKQMELEPQELIAAVYVARKPGRSHYYRKVGTRKAQAISKVCIAASTIISDGTATQVGMAMGSVAPIVCVCSKTMALLEGKPVGADLEKEIRQAVLSDISPIDDIRSNRDYRLAVAANLAVDFWKSLS
ncbi:MAG: xanthine dehydrogenase family protein subunit M [Candidatus Eremiobacteraeota bacterium]|nr:xanthine dehydrogenase family protein subunit M [Candidatus Eremiobacteraeota bacterium]